MREYLEKILRQRITIKENNNLYDKLPLLFKGRYNILNVESGGVKWIAISPKTDVGLVSIRKDRAQVQQAAALNCAVFLKSATPYVKEKLLDEGIPFVVLGKQVYLPFMGYLLSDSCGREIAPVHLISFLTQKLILTAIYDDWKTVTVSEAAARLDVSKMSVSRCFDEIEYLHIDILGKKGKSRAITVPSDKKYLWEQLQHVLRNPVIARYKLSEDIHLTKKAGISALCEYTMLNDNEYPTYAVTKKELSVAGIKNRKVINKGEDIGCEVIELGYFIDFRQMSLQDPLSVLLSLTDEENQDERVEMSINEMLGEYVW